MDTMRLSMKNTIATIKNHTHYTARFAVGGFVVIGV